MRFGNKTFKTGKNFTKCSLSVKGGDKFVDSELFCLI